jgi:hypothetical protein
MTLAVMQATIQQARLVGPDNCQDTCTTRSALVTGCG